MASLGAPNDEISRVGSSAPHVKIAEARSDGECSSSTSLGGSDQGPKYREPLVASKDRSCTRASAKRAASDDRGQETVMPPLSPN